MLKNERRKSPRVSSLSGMHFPAEIRASQNQSLSGTLLNLSPQGALFQLDRHQSSPLRVDERISVKLRLPKDVMWLAGIVRHHSGSRLGIFFPAGVGAMLNKSHLSPRNAIQPIRHHRAPRAVVQSL